jgi:hypothetical protein
MPSPRDSADESVAQIAAGVRRLLESTSANIRHADELAPLLFATHARAVGCWRYAAGRLQLAGFLAVPEMPADVQADFVAATREIALTETRLGVVQAIARNGPALNHRADNPKVPAIGSIGWLGRFQAASSLAVPLTQESELIGALAVATGGRIEPNDPIWRLVTAIAERL